MARPRLSLASVLLSILQEGRNGCTKDYRPVFLLSSFVSDLTETPAKNVSIQKFNRIHDNQAMIEYRLACLKDYMNVSAFWQAIVDSKNMKLIRQYIPCPFTYAQMVYVLQHYTDDELLQIMDMIPSGVSLWSGSGAAEARYRSPRILRYLIHEKQWTPFHPSECRKRTHDLRDFGYGLVELWAEETGEGEDKHAPRPYPLPWRYSIISMIREKRWKAISWLLENCDRDIWVEEYAGRYIHIQFETREDAEEYLSIRQKVMDHGILESVNDTVKTILSLMQFGVDLTPLLKQQSPSMHVPFALAAACAGQWKPEYMVSTWYGSILTASFYSGNIQQSNEIAAMLESHPMRYIPKHNSLMLSGNYYCAHMECFTVLKIFDEMTFNTTVANDLYWYSQRVGSDSVEFVQYAKDKFNIIPSVESLVRYGTVDQLRWLYTTEGAMTDQRRFIWVSSRDAEITRLTYEYANPRNFEHLVYCCAGSSAENDGTPLFRHSFSRSCDDVPLEYYMTSVIACTDSRAAIALESIMFLLSTPEFHEIVITNKKVASAAWRHEKLFDAIVHDPRAVEGILEYQDFNIVRLPETIRHLRRLLGLITKMNEQIKRNILNACYKYILNDESHMADYIHKKFPSVVVLNQDVFYKQLSDTSLMLIKKLMLS